MDILQFKNKYIEDAMDLLTKLDNDLVEFEKNPEDLECIEQIFRVMHTLKGTSGMYGFDHIANITHDLESVFGLVRDNILKVNTELFNMTLASVDHIRNLLSDETLSIPENITIHNRIKEQIALIMKKTGKHIYKEMPDKRRSPDASKIRTWQILFTPDEEIMKRSINILATFTDLLKLGTYKIQEPDSKKKIFSWAIFLITDKTLNDIEDELIFIMDYCKIQLIADFDIFKEEELANRDKEIEQLYELEQSTESTEMEKGAFGAIKAEQHLKIEKQTTKRINVDSSKLDHLMFLVSELVTTKSELMLSIDQKNEEKILECAFKVDKITKLLRDNALSIRLISIQEMTMRFKRLVRDLSNTLGKKIEFEIHGEEVELDKNIIDNISEPIMHLIRNCIDHGIETPEERIAANKPETGIIKLFAFKSGNFVFVQISDDGKGIDKQKIITKAVGMGLIKENTAFSDKEIYDLIFIPGFSTAESLTQVSGRGVGMDIVRKKIQEVRGEIQIDSETGLGTSFTLKLQQTISIIDTLLIRSDNSKFAIPLEEVENCQLVESQIFTKKQNKQIQYVNELIPYISLRDEFNYKSQTPDKQRMIVINKQEKRFAVVVDEIIGEYQAVVKSIGNAFSQAEFISGASLLGDGGIALLIDTEKLKKLITNNQIIN